MDIKTVTLADKRQCFNHFTHHVMSCVSSLSSSACCSHVCVSWGDFVGRIFHNDQVLAHLHQSLFVFFLHLQISACESSWKRKMKNCAKSIISCLKSLFIKWTLMHTKDTNILLLFELSYSGMGKQILKKLHSHQQWVGIAIFIKIIYMFIEDKSGLCTL